MCFFLVFFFKQKTAYEMRISDWSSDVCSSDLIARFGHREQRAVPAISPAVIGAHEPLGCAGRFQHDAGTAMPADIVECTYLIARTAGDDDVQPDLFEQLIGPVIWDFADVTRMEPGLAPEMLHLQVRSEEHTSELQSLMRISYAF